MKRGRRFLADSGGGAGAELVLALPIMLVLLFGTLELGHYFFTEHQILKGVRDGARYGSRQSFVDANCSGGSPSTLPAGIVTSIKNVTRTGFVSGGTTRVNGWINNDVTVTLSCPTTAITTGIYNGADNAPQINVTASVDYPSLLGDLGFLNFTGMKLNATQQSAVLGI